MKGQINIEFLASAMLYLIALGAVVTASSAVLPAYSQETQKAELNLESRSTTFKLLTDQGRHSFSGGGTNWERNNTTRDATTSLGITNGEDFHLDRGKINALRTVGENYFNYSQFREVVDVDNQYKFNFTWTPIVHTEESFTKGKPPTSPNIDEPSHPAYPSVDNEVHYGSTTIAGQNYRFLVTARNSIYNATYVSSGWDFSNAVPLGESETLNVYGTEYRITRFQNKDDDRGALLLLGKHLKTFGADTGEASTVIKFNRYAVMEGEPVRIGVWTW